MLLPVLVPVLLMVQGCAVTIRHGDVFELRERQVAPELVRLPDGFDRGRVQALAIESQGRQFQGYRVQGSAQAPAPAPQGRRAVLFFTGSGYGASAALLRTAPLFDDGLTDLYVLSYGQAGESPPTVGQVYAMAEQLASHAMQASQLADRNRLIAVGHSLGGWVAQHLGATERAGCVVLVGAGTTAAEAGQRLLPGALSAAVRLKPDDDVRRLDNLEQARRNRASTLVVGSQQDETMPAALSQAIFGALPAASAVRLYIDPAASHGGYFRTPEVVEAIRAFLRERCRP